jgi:hypothetical protein
MSIFGVNPNSCPEGLRHMIVHGVYKAELDAAASKGIITKVEAKESELDDILFIRKGIRTTKLNSERDRQRFGVDNFPHQLRFAIHAETRIGRTATHRHLLRTSSISGTLKEFLGTRATLVEMPGNNISQGKSTDHMRKVRTQLAVNHNSSDTILYGIADIVKNVRTKWRSGMQEKSPYTKKTINLNRLLRSIKTDSDEIVFTALCPILLGENVGSTLATSVNKPDVIEFRDKFADNPIAMAYWIAYEEFFIDLSCINIMMADCDPEEVLLISETDYDKERRMVITPFEEPEDEFVRLAEEDGIVLDLSSMEQPSADDNVGQDGVAQQQVHDSPDPQNQLRADYARRLRLRDDATFETRNSDVVSRVTGATVNTYGAMSNRTTTTVDANRNFRDECLARARAKAAATAWLKSPRPANPLHRMQSVTKKNPCKAPRPTLDLPPPSLKPTTPLQICPV